jgi:hypothetical protein
MRKDMNNLILVTPTKEHESQVMEFCEEMLKNGEGYYGCFGLNSVSSYDDVLAYCTVDIYPSNHSYFSCHVIY